MEQTMDAETLKREIEQFLAAHHVINLGTLPAAPHMASLMYAIEGLSLIWESKPDTRHSKHLVADPRVAATVAPDYTDHRQIRGLQIFGTAKRIAEGEDLGRAKRLLIERYAFIRELAAGPLREKFHSAGFYRLSPERITLIDCTKVFGTSHTLLVHPGGEVSMSA